MIIIWSLYFSFRVFTGQVEPPSLFDMSQKEIEETGISFNNEQDLEESVKALVGSQIQNMVPSEFINKLFDLMALSVFVGLLIFGGGKVSLIGTKLLNRHSHD